jgi:hypothetical protein
MTETTLFSDTDHAGRRWVVTARPYQDLLIVNFTCWNARGLSKALDQTSAWGEDGWDLSRPWLPTSPRPVPDRILDSVERQLKELVRQQQAQLQQEGVGRG